MRIRFFAASVCLIPLFTAVVASAQSDDEPANRFRLSYRAGFNIRAQIKNLGTPGVPGGPSVTGLSYEDGFVRPNSVPNDLGLSWNWGYQKSSQVVGDTVVMTSSQPGKLGSSYTEGPANGFELTCDRQLGRWKGLRWGIEGAFNFTDFSINNNSTPAGSVLTAHAFSLGGSLPPVSPYAGSSDGPGVLISDLAAPVALNVGSKIDTSVVGFRLGPYVELPLGKRVAVSLSGGLALAWVDSTFSFQEVVTIASASSVTRSARNSGNDCLPGWYVGADLSVKLCRSWSLFAGGQLQDIGNQVVRAGDKQAKLELGESIFVSAGLSFSF